MAPRPVFEGAQAEFLSDRLADFCASQDEKDVSTFMAQTYTEFFETWPEDDEKKKKKLNQNGKFSALYLIHDPQGKVSGESIRFNQYLIISERKYSA